MIIYHQCRPAERWRKFDLLKLISVILVVLTTTCTTARSEVTATKTLFEKLEGRWKGWGWLEVTSGDRERIRCLVTYQLLDGGNKSLQKLRCASSTYLLDATATLKNRDGVISGTWKESNFAAEGTITGRATKTFASIRLDGDNLNAGMSITARGACNQSVRILPQNTDIKTMAIHLKRC